MNNPMFNLSFADKKRFAKIQKSLFLWHKNNRREFSWRKKIRHPYEVLVCEVMGQQTQASRIEQFLPRFLKRFPTIEALVFAKKSDVIREWQGLGYNRRALNLHLAAKMLSENYPNSFPKTEEELLALPGIGKYTARAILIFAFNKPIATVDVNIQRLLSRLYKKMPDRNSVLPVKDIISLSENILPVKNSRTWHETLMDFGAMICTKRNPGCGECPLFRECKSGKVIITAPIIPKNRSVNLEPKYFGHPKRIWRGKILKIISVDATTTESMIRMAVQNSFAHSEFSPFIRSILSELTREGFCEKKKNIYQLRQG